VLVFLGIVCQSRRKTVRPGSSARGGTTTRRTATSARGGVSGGMGSTGPRQYRSNTLLGDATIEIDPETRSLIVVTDEETHGQLDRVIQNLDRPKPQVLIKVVFVEVTYNKGYDVGLEGTYTYNKTSAKPASTVTTDKTVTENGTTSSGGTTSTVTKTTEALTNAATVAETVASGSNFGIAAALAAGAEGAFARGTMTDDWTATLHALATRGKVEVLSRPSIMARNNQEAVIVVGQEVPFITSSRITELGQTINTIAYDNVGIILRVTPFITTEGTVEMIVAPEISTLTDQTVRFQTMPAPRSLRNGPQRRWSLPPDGATVVIGGLMETQRTHVVRKVPLLGDIPLIGVAFRRTVQADTKRELMIFLTPHNRQQSETSQ
jgi:general secretion pathway protein D